MTRPVDKPVDKLWRTGWWTGDNPVEKSRTIRWRSGR